MELKMYNYSELKYCPRCGKFLEEKVESGRKRKICPSCNYILYRNPVPVANVIVENEKGEIVLGKRAIDPKKGEWALPGGYVEYDEDPKEAAKREVLEEIGLEVEIQELIDVYHRKTIEEKYVVPIVYSAKITGGFLCPGDDTEEVRYYNLKSLPKLAFRHNLEAIKEWRKKYGR